MIHYIRLNKHFISFINATKNGKRLKKNGTKILKVTVRNYQSVYKLLVKFELTKERDLLIPTLKTLNQKDQIKIKEYWADFYNEFTTFLYNDRGLYDNYVGLVIKIFRAFLNWMHQAKGYELGNIRHIFYVRSENTPVLTFSQEQLKFLMYDKDFEESLPPYLKIAKNSVVFGCLTGLRFSDLIKLKTGDLVRQDDNVYINSKSQKTGNNILIKLSPYAVNIINNSKKRQNKRLFQKISLVNFNKNIKQIAELAGWDYYIGKKRDRKGISRNIDTKSTKHKSYRFCDLVTSHTMRRTAISNLLMLGVPEMIVRNFSGHAENSQSFARYVNLAQTYLDKELGDAFNKLEAK
jgi:integrase